MKIYNLSNETLLEKIQELFIKSNEATYIRKLDIINLVLSGNKVQTVSELYKIHRTTIYKWINKAKKYGLESLKDQPKEGKPSKIMDIELKKIKRDLLKSPLSFGYKNATWDGKLLSYHLKQKFDIELGVRQCQRLFHKLNFSPKETSSGTS